MDYIWDLLGVEQKQWKKLCDAIWKRIFQSEDVLYGLEAEELEERHEIERKESVEMVKDITSKMQQQVLWDEKATSHSKFARTSNYKQKKKMEVQQKKINEYYSKNQTEIIKLNQFQQENLYSQEEQKIENNPYHTHVTQIIDYASQLINNENIKNAFNNIEYAIFFNDQYK
eukprot:TRINITY_DN14168_c0_g1_i1.p1 TRINITY_DN14168_c0_g1~~TRINITY_DN14168_c0_g1_i1.p1  ORF type:complete len:172 (-),score=38.20 TRINITY_DN14168_c0_g1_i1:20-535(-)